MTPSILHMRAPRAWAPALAMAFALALPVFAPAQQANDTAPTYPQLIKRARRLIKQEKPHAAIRLLERAVESAPGAADPHFLLSDVHDGLNKVQQAEDQLLRALEKGGGDKAVNRLRRYASKRMSAKKPDYARARDLLEACLEVQPKNGRLLSPLATCYYHLGQHDKEVEIARRMFEPLRASLAQGRPAPEKPNGVMNVLARALVAAGRAEEALTRFRSMRLLSGPEGDLGRLMVEAVSQRRFNAVYQEGERQLRDKNYEEARRKFREALELEPTNPLPYKRISVSYAREDRNPEAEMAALRAYEMEPDDGSRGLLLSHANRHARNKSYDRALELVAPLLEADPEDWGAIEVQARCYWSMKDYERLIELGERALVLYDALAERAPDEKPPRYGVIHYYSLALSRAGDIEAAIARREAAVGPDGPNPYQNYVLFRLYSEFGNELLRRGERDAAVVAMRKAAESEPDLVWSHRQLARSLHDAGLLDEAIAHLESMKERFPEDWGHREQLAFYLYEAKRYREALDVLREVEADKPGRRQVLDRIVQCLVKLDRHAEAVAMIEEMILKLELSDMDEDKKQRAIGNLETRHLNILDDAPRLVASRMAAARAEATSNPAAAAPRLRLGDFYLHQGMGALALSEHLVAARLDGSPNHLYEEARKLARAQRGAEAIPYIEAIFELYPADERVFELMNRYISLKTLEGVRRFAFNAELVAAYKTCEETCKRILAMPDLPDPVAVRAELRRIQYRYEPLPNERELWLAARKEIAALLERENLEPDLRREVLEALADVDLERLQDSEAAYRIHEAIARQEPNRGNIVRLHNAAERVNPPPPPVLMDEFWADNPRDHDIGFRLGQWQWEAGQRDAAVRTLSQVFERASRGRRDRGPAFWWKRRLRRSHPELARLLDLDGEGGEDLDTVELVYETVWQTAAPDLVRGRNVVFFTETRLALPSALTSGTALRLLAAERPVVLEPPVLVRRWDGVRSAQYTNLDWAAVWRSGAFLQPAEGAAARFRLSSAHVERPVGPFEIHRAFDPEMSEEEGVLFQAYVRAPGAREARFSFSRGVSGLRDFVPPDSAELREDEVVFTNLDETTIDDIGTTFSMRMDFPKRRHFRWARSLPMPDVEILVDETVTTVTLARTGVSPEGEGGTRALRDLERGVVFEIQSPPGESAGPAAARVVRREVVRLDAVEVSM